MILTKLHFTCLHSIVIYFQRLLLDFEISITFTPSMVLFPTKENPYLLDLYYKSSKKKVQNQAETKGCVVVILLTQMIVLLHITAYYRDPQGEIAIVLFLFYRGNMRDLPRSLVSTWSS